MGQAVLKSSFLSILILLSGQMDWVSADMGNRDEQTLMRFEEGMAYWKSGDRAAALAAFEAVTTQRLDYAAPFGFTFPRKGTPGLEGAREDFRTILLGPPDEAEAHFFVGNIWMDRLQWSDSTEHFRETIRLKPDHVAAQFNLGLQWVRVRNWESAVAPLREAVNLAPSDPHTHLLLTTALIEVGTTSALREALEAARMGARRHPDNPAMHFRLGYALLRLARRDEAAEEFQAYLRLEAPDPSRNSDIQRAQAYLKEMAPYLSP